MKNNSIGQKYEADKERFDTMAKDYISKNLIDVNDVCHIPSLLKTWTSTYLVKKLDNDKFITFIGKTEEIIDGKERSKYLSDKMKKKEVIDMQKLIRTIGFGYCYMGA